MANATTALLPDGDDDTTDEVDYYSATITLSILLAALALGNVVVCLIIKASPGDGRKHPLQPRASCAPLVLSSELNTLRKDLAAERRRRKYAEAIIARAKSGGCTTQGTKKFPRVHEVIQHFHHLEDFVVRWTGKADTSEKNYEVCHKTIRRILIETFIVCREEVDRCLEERLRSLSAFLGGEEPVTLLGDGTMNLDTQYVLYECLCRNFRSIVPIGQGDIQAISKSILQRCEGQSDQSLAETLIFGDARFSFEVLLKNYLTIFLECALQNPPMTFQDDLGDIYTFNPAIHQDWFPFTSLPSTGDGSRCCIVFPSMTSSPHFKGRIQNPTKSGVVRVKS